MVNLVEFPVVPLGDIPARMRKLADEIEAGDYGDIESASVLLPRPGDFPLIFGFGDVGGEYSPLVQLQLALHWFCSNIVARS